VYVNTYRLDDLVRRKKEIANRLDRLRILQDRSGTKIMHATGGCCGFCMHLSNNVDEETVLCSELNELNKLKAVAVGQLTEGTGCALVIFRERPSLEALYIPARQGSPAEAIVMEHGWNDLEWIYERAPLSSGPI